MAALCRTFFAGNAASNSENLDIDCLYDRISVLLHWSTGLYRLGPHRPYAVFTLLKVWLQAHNSTQGKIHHVDMFVLLFRWLDTSPAARKSENVQAIRITFGEMIRSGLFSYTQYLNALIARGETARSRQPDTAISHHLELLRGMPFFVEASPLRQQRLIALCGDDVEQQMQLIEQEDLLSAEFRAEVLRFVPELFDDGSRRVLRPEGPIDVSGVQQESATSSSVFRDSSPERLSRYLYVQARFWLFPVVVSKIRSVHQMTSSP